jgi:hypothetical protein
MLPADRHDRSDRIAKAVSAGVVLLVGLEGMSYAETAAILDIPVGTVRSRLSRGRDSLRRLMDVMPDAPRVDTMPALAQAA